MIIEGIKNLLGEDLTKQVETALKGKGKDGKDVDLVIGNDGSFVPAEKYNGANSGKTSAENALKAAAEALKAIGGSGDPAKIAEDVKTAQTTIKSIVTGAILEPNSEMVVEQLRKNSSFIVYDGQEAAQGDEKPLSKMNKDELLKVAQDAEIAVPDGATKAEIVELIKAAQGDE